MKAIYLILRITLLILASGTVLRASPDLVPTALEVPPVITGEPNPSVTITSSVANEGTDSTWPRWDVLYLSTHPSLDSTAIQLSSWYSWDALAPGETASETFTLTLPITVTDNYFILFKADGYESIIESDEGNNVIVTPFRFESRPADLAPVAFQAPNPIVGPPNSTVTLVWAVTNKGPGSALGGWIDSVYLSTNTTNTTGALSLGSFYKPGPVATGSVYWQTNLINIPVVESGKYYLVFKTDTFNDLFEPYLTDNTMVMPVTLTIQQPDLAPVLLLAETNVVSLANPYVTVVWGVTNQGLGRAQGYWMDQLFLSTNSILEPGLDSYLSYSNENGPIAPGEVYWRTNVWRIPMTQSGTYFLLFKTDVQNSLVESDIENNVAALPIVFTAQQADLAPVMFRVPTALTNTPNPNLTLSWGVTNQGTGLATGYWIDQVYLSYDATLDSSDRAVYSQSENIDTDVGTTYWRTNVLRVPVTQSGTYYLIFTTDAGNSLNEVETNNNTLAQPITFTIQPPNLAPVFFQAPDRVSSSPNPQVQLVWGVTNQGPGAASGWWYDRVYLSTDAQLGSSDQVLGNWSHQELAAGGSYWATNTLRIPMTQSGSYYLIFVANADPLSPLFESDYADNIKVGPITFNISSPDLAPVTSLVPKQITGSPNPLVTFVLGITNQGPGAAGDASWNNQVYLSNDSVFNSDDPLLTYWWEYDSIPAGSILWQTNLARIPVTESGSYYLIFQVNPSKYLFESNYENNTAIVPVSFDIKRPDLAPITFQMPASVIGPPYPSVNVVWGVTNQGIGPAIATWTWSDRLYISTNAVWDSRAVDFFGVNEEGSVSPGDTYWRSNTVRLPISASGLYYVFFKADAYQNLSELDRSNNMAVAVLDYNAQLPDLRPIGLQAPDEVTGPPYPSVTYVWGITNQGVGTAISYSSGWADAVTLSTNTTWNWSDPQVDYSYFSGPVSAGGVYWRTNTVRMPVTQSGTYNLMFNTDANQALVESDNSNNTANVSIKFNILPPDLSPIALQVPSLITGPPNPSVTLVWGITNQGIGPAMAYTVWNDQVYFSTDPEWGWQDNVVASLFEPGPVPAGGSYWRTNTVRLPVVRSGSYYLILKVDSANGLFETDDNNNQLVVPISFQITPPDLVPVVSSVSNSVACPPNPNLTFIWGVTNIGSGAAFGMYPWADRVYFSTNPRLDGRDAAVFSSSEIGPIEPGAAAWQTNTFRVPIVQSGTNYLIFEANSDTYYRLIESDYSNNFAVVPISFEVQKPDLMPVALRLPREVISPPNPTITVVWGITNQGVGPALPGWWPSWSDELFLSTNVVPDEMKPSIAVSYEFEPILPKSLYWRTNSIRLPITQSGTYYFTLQADANGFLYESDYGNNSLMVPVTFTIQPPDLSPVVFNVPTNVDAAPNPRLLLVWGVTNQGIGRAEGYWYDKVYLSTNSVLDAGAVPVGSGWIGFATPAGGTYWFSNSIQIPVVKSGNYYLILQANADQALFESDFANNVIVKPINFNILPPDLSPIAINAPRKLTGPPYPSLNLSWGVTNQGTGVAYQEYNWVDRIYLSEDPELQPWNASAVVTEYERGPIQPGTDYWHTRVVQLPVTASGTYYLLAQVDGGNGVYESDEDNNAAVVPIDIEIQKPDLKPLVLEAPESVRSSISPTIKMSWGVTNQGSGAAIHGWQDGIYLSLDDVFDYRDQFIGSRSEQGPVTAGSSYWRSQTFQVPVTNSGKYFVIFKTDANDGEYEADEQNNVLAVPVQFDLGGPDLAPMALLAPAEINGAANPMISVVWGVTNQGAGSAMQNGYSWVDRVYISTNIQLNPNLDETVRWQYENGLVPAGGVYWRTNLVRLPLNTDGTYYLFFQVNSDAYWPIYETDYSNNLIRAKLSVKVSAPDLAPVFFSGPPTISTGFPQVTLVWGITNQGAGAASTTPYPWTDSVTLNKTNPANGSSVSLGQWSWTSINALAPGDVYWSTNSTILPITQSGDYLLTLTSDVYDNTGEANRTNNSLTFAFSARVPPSDLSPIFFAGPAEISPNPSAPVTLIWGVTNLGPTATQLDPGYFWQDRLYLSTTNFLDASAISISYWLQQQSVPVGGSYWRTNVVNLPIQTSGEFFLHLQVDASNQLGEENISNNVASIPLSAKLRAAPDLSPIFLQGDSSLTSPPNPTVRLIWAVTNSSSSTAPAGWTDAFYLSTTPVLDGTETSFGSIQETDSLAGGATYWRTNSLTVPVTSSGTYYLILRAGSFASFSESNYWNNTIATPIEFKIKRPDLAAFCFQVLNKVAGAPYVDLAVVIGVTNQGAGTALLADDALYISASPVHDLSARAVAWWSRTNAVNPGDTYWITNTVRLPVGDSGDYYLIFEADTGNALKEADRLNSVAVVPIRVDLSLQPDLVTEEFIAPTLVAGNGSSSVQLIWHVVNEGLGPARSPWFDSVLFVTNSWLNGSVLAVFTETNDVSVGADYWRTNSVTVPVTQNGYFYLRFQANSYEDVFELDLGNNTKLVPLNLVWVPPGQVRIVRSSVSVDGYFGLAVSGSSGVAYTLQTSSDLSNWYRACDFICTSDPTWVTDKQARGLSQRFYRVMSFPNSLLQMQLSATPALFGNGCELKLEAPLARAYRVDASTNLVDWHVLTNFSNTTISPVYFQDTPAAGDTKRFYRAVAQ